jgi:hypothetical protein
VKWISASASLPGGLFLSFSVIFTSTAVLRHSVSLLLAGTKGKPLAELDREWL